MAIINGPWTRSYEGPHHLRAKVRVANLIDSFLEGIKKRGWTVETEYEKFYPTFLTTLGPKKYRADVSFDVFYPNEHEIRHHTMSAEIDGTVGHHSDWEGMKDKVRDEKLHEMMSPVIRIDTYSVTGYARKKPSLHPDIRRLTDKELLEHFKPVENLRLPLLNTDL